MLRSDRLEHWTVGRTRKVWEMLARRVPALDGQDPVPASPTCDASSDDRAPALVSAGRTMVAQACGAVILLVALRSLGVG